MIFSEVHYQETGSGGAEKEGREFDETGRGFLNKARGAEESHEKTLRAGRKRILSLAARMGIQNTMISGNAFSYYSTVLDLKMTQGRTGIDIVDAACLYMACKQEGTPHLLEDFAKAINTNLHLLGKCVTAYQQALKQRYFAAKAPNVIRAPSINSHSALMIPSTDPRWAIERFAHKLETQLNTAAERATMKSIESLRWTRLTTAAACEFLKYMDRAGMLTGRRPQSVQGAALMLAGQKHGIKRCTPTQVGQVVQCQPKFIRNRIKEYHHHLAQEEKARGLAKQMVGMIRRRSSARITERVGGAQGCCADGRTAYHCVLGEGSATKIGLSQVVKVTRTTSASHPSMIDDSNLSDVDGEIDQWILTPRSVERKTALWNSINKEWEDEQKVKDEKKAEVAREKEENAERRRKVANVEERTAALAKTAKKAKEGKKGNGERASMEAAGGEVLMNQMGLPVRQSSGVRVSRTASGNIRIVKSKHGVAALAAAPTKPAYTLIGNNILVRRSSSSGMMPRNLSTKSVASGTTSTSSTTSTTSATSTTSFTDMLRRRSSGGDADAGAGGSGYPIPRHCSSSQAISDTVGELIGEDNGGDGWGGGEGSNGEYYDPAHDGFDDFGGGFEEDFE
jgi:transcription initiation factor TFIIIB Brf1 subunit/transcription initiation factor TFIIB